MSWILVLIITPWMLLHIERRVIFGEWKILL